MSGERYTFEQARIRLEEIATLARKKDTSLEKSLDLLEEGVRLANICTELVDHTDLSATAESPEDASAVVEATPQGGVVESAGPAEDGAEEAVSLAEARTDDDGYDEPAGMDEPGEDVEGGATEESDELDA